MFYHIKGLHPIHEYGGYGFTIQLWPNTLGLVKRSKLNQEKINIAIETCGMDWLCACGYDTLRSDPRFHINVLWGDWGVEHITVPGNSCGLDIDRGSIGAPQGGMILLPHNVDNWMQVQLLLVVFTWFADCIILLSGSD